MGRSIAVAILAASLLGLAVADSAPEQIHLWVGGDTTEYWVSYVTQDDNADTTVNYGTDPSNLDTTVSGSSVYFGTDGHMFTQHWASMADLKANTVYYYALQTASKISPMLNFTAAPVREGGTMFGIYADLGMANDVSLNALIGEVTAHNLDYIIHPDDLHTNSGLNGDQFLNAIQPITQAIPYMVAVGNHEDKYNFTHYLNRFTAAKAGAGVDSDSNTNLWYSFNIDNVHFVAIDTELADDTLVPAQMERQLNWLEADLIAANLNRDEQPWIVMFGHKAWWMTDTNFTAFDDLAYKYGVDLYFCGHVHNYQRNYPQYQGNVDTGCVQNGNYVNPSAMTTFIVGSAGCEKDIGTKVGPSASLAYNSMTYGFGALQVVNDTHAHWQWIQTMAPGSDDTPVDDDPKPLRMDADWVQVRTVIDELWIIQEVHGPYA